MRSDAVSDGLKALVIVDVQIDFCEGGALGVPGGARVASRINEYVHANRNVYRAIVVTQDWHIDPSGHFADDPDRSISWPRHCVAETAGAMLHPALCAHGVGDWLDVSFRKGMYSDGYSGFEGVNDAGDLLGDWLRRVQIETVDVVGIAGRGCVRATTMAAVGERFAVRLLTDMCADRPEPAGRTQEVLDEMTALGVEVRRQVL